MFLVIVLLCTKVLLGYNLVWLFFSRLVTGGISVGHFSHVFVDEAGQAEEPQCIIAVAGKFRVF